MRVSARRTSAIVAVALVACVSGAAASLPVLQPVTLPADHGAHPSFQVEWWYTAGTVATRSGRDFFWFATVWSGGGFVLGRVNVVDLRADRTVLSKEYLASAGLGTGQTGLNAGGLALGWQPVSTLGRWTVVAPVSGQGLLRLTLTPIQPYVLNGPNGIVAEGPGAVSAYYSGPRLAAAGALILGRLTSPVTGQGWLDHQWGNFATNSASWHWNWFACQFRNDSDLMLYQFITPSGRPVGTQDGTFVSPDGVVTHPQLFTVRPLQPTIRPAGATGRYPLRWRLDVPSAHLNITLRSRARDQFIANQYIPGFWEGAAAITAGPHGTCIVESTREHAGVI